MYTFRANYDFAREKPLNEFHHIIKHSRGGIVSVRSKSRSWGKFAASGFLRSAFASAGLYPTTIEEISIGQKSIGPLWVETHTLIAKENILSETQWLLATQGFRHIVLIGTINSFLLRLCSLISKRTFIWIVSSGPSVPFRYVHILELDDVDNIDEEFVGSYEQLAARINANTSTSDETFRMLSISSIDFGSALTQNQCMTLVAFFVAANQKDVLHLYGRQRSTIGNHPNLGTTKRRRGDDDGFNARIVSKHAVNEAYNQLLRQYFATFTSERNIQNDQRFLKESKQNMALLPTNFDIEVLCRGGYVSLLKPSASNFSYDFIEAHESPRAKYKTYVPYKLLEYCCSRLSFDVASFV